MKKVLVVLFVLLMTAGFVACSDDDVAVDGSSSYFNLGDISSGGTISVSSSADYGAGFNTGGSWVQVKLDLSGVTINPGTDKCLIRWGSGISCQVWFDEFMYE